MSASNVDLLIEQGATFERTITISDANCVPMDITGWEFRGQIRRTYSDTTVLASFSFTIQDQVTKPGQVLMFMSATTTAAIPVNPASDSSTSCISTPNLKPTNYVYDVEAETSSDFVYRILQGLAIVSPDVTRGA